MSKHVSTRRRFLAAGLFTVLPAFSGCLDGSEPRSDADRSLHFALFPKDGPLREEFVVDLSATRPEWDEEAFEATLNGSTYTTQYRKPFVSASDDPEYALWDGTYYQLGSVVVDEASEQHPVLRLTKVESGETEMASTSVAADTLPESDQRAVHIAHMAARARDNIGGVPWGLVERDGYVFRQEELIETSQLLDENGPEYVTHRETQYAVAVTEEQFYEPIYRATIEPVATSPEQMEAILKAARVEARISRDELSTDAREVLRQARGDGYSETHPYSSGYREVLRALHEWPYLDGNIEKDAFSHDHGAGMVSYADGDYAEYRLRFKSGSTEA